MNTFDFNTQGMKGSYMSKRGYVIRKEFLTYEQLKTLKEELIGRPLQDDKYTFFNNQNSTFPLYIETQNKIYIPKMYGYTKFGKPDKQNDNYVGIGWPKQVSFTGTLYPYQKEPCEILLESLRTVYGGILALGTGFGKTISTLYVLSQLQKKTLIIVNKVSLMKQWQKEITTFLPSATVGFIQGQKNVDIEGKDIVIAMLQSLARIDYPDCIFNEFGATVVDEIHNVSSPVFSRVLSKVCSQYTIGLSATPKRSDGCEYVFKWFIGDIVFQSTSERKGLTPTVQIIKTDTKDYVERASVNKMTGQKQIMFSSMITDLVEMENRNKLIVSLIKQFVKEDGRKVLVLTDRRVHAKKLQKLIVDDASATFSHGLFLGQMKVADLERSKTCQVILATFQAFGEGVSERELNTLILATPKKFIGHLKNTKRNESGKLEQIVGRIFRKEHTEIHPLIVDINDNFSVYKVQSNQRYVFYKEHFPSVQFVYQRINLDDVDFSKNDILSHLSDVKVTHQTSSTPSIYTDCLL